MLRLSMVLTSAALSFPLYGLFVSVRGGDLPVPVQCDDKHKNTIIKSCAAV